ncbi:MAG: amidophosphoribosyltransferase [bacterium]|nr:amidophosphoribosyltransferase [bacterium]
MIYTDKLKEKCGVFGVYGKDLDVSRLTYFGLWALQHRGQESSGIVTANSNKFFSHTKPGLVAQVFDDGILDYLKGHIAIGHNRYSTSGGSHDAHSQPVIYDDDSVSLAHNGNLPSTRQIEDFLISKDRYLEDRNDSEMMADAIRYYLDEGNSLKEAISASYDFFTGAFSTLVITKNQLAAFRDKYGIRPLAIGKLNGGYVFSSETCAIDTVGAKYLRDVRPGELVIAGENGLKSYQLAKPNPKLEIFEFIYFSRPDSVLLGQKVNEVRRRLGMNLAKESPVNADVVIPIPDSAIPAALGYSSQSKIPFDHGLIKNRYIHRTFIQPVQKLRERDVQMKLNPLKEVLNGKDVIVIDDSIVRGTTMKKIVQMLRQSGVKKVHIRVSSPPIKYPDFYGIDTPNQKKLIAASLNVDQIKNEIGADSLNFLSYPGMIDAIGIDEDKLCTACFSGDYPIDLLERSKEVSLIA